MTSQIYLDSYIDAGVITAMALANELTPPEVADPGWLVRHVLYHGPDAEVVQPPEMRDLVRQRIAQILRSQEEREWSGTAS